MVGSAGLLLLFLALVMFCSGGMSMQDNDFCARAIVNSEACPEPPTVESIDVKAYLGKWYEIGSTATFKLLTESGLICSQARYSQQGDGSLTLVNSGLRVISTLAISEVAAISLASAGACTQARSACTTLIGQSNSIAWAQHKVSEAIQKLNHPTTTELATSLTQLSLNITASVASIRGSLSSLSDIIEQIQFLNGEISQGNPTPNLANATQLLKENAKQASTLQASSILTLTQTLTLARSKLGEIGRKSPLVKVELAEAATSLTEATKQLLVSSAGIELALSGIRGSSSLLSWNGKAIVDGKISAIDGRITSNKTSIGKLTARIVGMDAPYWIVALEGEAKEGYKAALVYSCTKNVVIGVAKSLFILSRTPELDAEVVSHFLSLAQSYGIYTHCNDPFVLSVQKGGTCGAPS